MWPAQVNEWKSQDLHKEIPVLGFDFRHVNINNCPSISIREGERERESVKHEHLKKKKSPPPFFLETQSRRSSS